MSDVPERRARRRGRLTTQGRRTDGGGPCALFLTQEEDGSWTVQGPARLGEVALGVRLQAVDMVALAEAILERSR